MKICFPCFQHFLLPHILGLLDSVNDLDYKRIKPHLLQHLEISNLRSEIRKLIGHTVEELQARPVWGLNDELMKRMTGYKCQCSNPTCLECSRKCASLVLVKHWVAENLSNLSQNIFVDWENILFIPISEEFIYSVSFLVQSLDLSMHTVLFYVCHCLISGFYDIRICILLVLCNFKFFKK